MTRRPTCLRCGKALPYGSSQSRRYCDACAAERNRELTRERQRKAVKRMQEVNAEKNYNADREYCKHCEYHGGAEGAYNLCDYYLRTGERRGCRAGDGCERRALKKGDNGK